MRPTTRRPARLPGPLGAGPRPASPAWSRSRAALIVDADRPSVDHARARRSPAGRQRPDAPVPAAPLSIAERSRELGTAAALGRGRVRRPAAGRQPAGGPVLPAGLAGLVVAVARGAGLADRRPPALGRARASIVLRVELGLGRWRRRSRPAASRPSPYLLAQTFEGHYPHVWAACWYPWAFWAFGRHRRGRLWGTLALPPILALDFLTGHPQEWYYLVLALSLWTLVDAYRRHAPVAGGRPRGGLLLWGGVLVLSLGLVAVELIPDLAAQAWTLGRPGSAPAGEQVSPPRVNLFQLLGPDALGGPPAYFGDDNYWETVLSIGLVPLVLAAIAVARHPDRTAVRGWACSRCCRRVRRRPSARRVSASCSPVRGWTGSGSPPGRSSSPTWGPLSFAASASRRSGSTPIRRPLARLERYYRLAGRGRSSSACCSLQALGGPFDPRRVPERPPPLAIRYGQAWTPTERVPRSARRPRRGPALAQRPVLAGARRHRRPARRGPVGDQRRRSARRRSRRALLGGLALVELGLHGHALVRVAPAERFLGRDPISAVLRRVEPPVVRTGPHPARDTLYPDIHAFANGIEKVNINDGFQLQHAADLYQTLYPLLYRLPPPDPEQPMSDCGRAVPPRGAPGGPRPAGRRLPGLGPHRARAGLAARRHGGLERQGFRDPPQSLGPAPCLRRPPCQAAAATMPRRCSRRFAASTRARRS